MQWLKHHAAGDVAAHLVEVTLPEKKIQQREVEMKTILSICMFTTAMFLGLDGDATASDGHCGNYYSYPMYYPAITYYSPPYYLAPPVYYRGSYNYYSTSPQYGFYYGYYHSYPYHYSRVAPYTYRFRSTYRRRW